MNPFILQGPLAPYVRDVMLLDKQLGPVGEYRCSTGSLGFMALALCGEAGELGNIVKKILRDGPTPELWAKLDEEAVDVLIYFIEFLLVSDTNLDEIWKRKHEILVQRVAEKNLKAYGFSDKSLDRGEEDEAASGGSGQGGQDDANDQSGESI